MEAHFAELLDSVEAGEEFAIVRGQKLVARLVPVTLEPKQPRPKVGEMISTPFEVPTDALAPFGAEELKGWGL